MQYGCKCRENAIYFNSSTIFFTIFLPVPSEFSFRSFFEIGFSSLLKYSLSDVLHMYIERGDCSWGEAAELVDSMPARILCRFMAFEYPFGWHYVHSISTLPPSSFNPLNPLSWPGGKQFNNATRCKINLSPQEINWKFIICHFGITK